jgi:hypothetical protein
VQQAPAGVQPATPLSEPAAHVPAAQMFDAHSDGAVQAAPAGAPPEPSAPPSAPGVTPEGSDPQHAAASAAMTETVITAKDALRIDDPSL